MEKQPENHESKKAEPKKLLLKAGSVLAALAALGCSPSEVSKPITTAQEQSTTSKARTKVESVLGSEPEKLDRVDDKTLSLSKISGQYKSHPELFEQGPAPLIDFSWNGQEIVYDDHSPEGLGDNSLVFFMAVNNNRQLIQTATQEGSLRKVSFFLIKDQPGQPEETHSRFVPKTSASIANREEIIVQLPQDKIMGSEEATLILRHELIHALTDKLAESMQGDKPTQAQIDNYAGVCNALRDTVVEQLKYMNANITYKLGQIAEQNNPQISEVINLVASSLKAGKSRQPLSGEVYTSIPPHDVVECYLNDPVLLVYQEMERRGISYDKLLITDEDATQVSRAWFDSLNSYSIYKELKESTYMPPSSDYPLGHPDDAWDELVTSTLNTSLSYPEDFARHVNLLNPQQKELILQLLRKSIDSLNQANPELEQLTSNAEAVILDKINK